MNFVIHTKRNVRLQATKQFCLQLDYRHPRQNRIKSSRWHFSTPEAKKSLKSKGLTELSIYQYVDPSPHMAYSLYLKAILQHDVSRIRHFCAFFEILGLEDVGFFYCRKVKHGVRL